MKIYSQILRKSCLVQGFLFLMLFSFSLKSQSLDSSLVKKRTRILLGTEVLGFSGMLYGLDKLWYSDYPRSKFHWFNDNNEWLQMDKVGHFGTAYYYGWMGYEATKWTGISDKKAIWWGGTAGFAFLTVIETLDAFSAEWGASPGDLIANTGGTFMFIGQQLAWGEQRLIMKFSHKPSSYANYRPEALGASYTEQLFKDYNAQTYWLSGHIASCTKKEGKLSFLNIALGYSGDGMTGGSSNPDFNALGEPVPSFQRARQFYLSLDADLSKIPVKNKFLKSTLKVINLIKVPFPGIEYHTVEGLKWNWLAY